MKRFLVALLVACGGSPQPATTPTPPPPARDAAVAPEVTGLSVVELKFFNGDMPKLVLHADGKLETNTAVKPHAKAQWIAMAQVTADGKIAHEGQPIGELKPDGTFVTPDGKVAPFKLEGDVLVLADKRVSLGDNGSLQGVDGSSAKLRVEGATDLGSRRTALLLLALMVLQP